MYARVLKQIETLNFNEARRWLTRERDEATISIRSRDFTIKPNSTSQTYPN